MLEVIETRVAEAGYVPNLSSVLHDIGEEEKENAIRVHSERLAIAFGFLVIGAGDCIRIVKNLRVCTDCHETKCESTRVYAVAYHCPDSSQKQFGMERVATLPELEELKWYSRKGSQGKDWTIEDDYHKYLKVWGRWTIQIIRAESHATASLEPLNQTSSQMRLWTVEHNIN
ncbi:hypothetical protein GH714_005941 [Hevea brasiliensis]|uniref:DYW domain-containing protein n=1 Tax=Hevea brasiliensis TaxID=3981 RepID=A0A6A6KZI2_HEVBR|nr:hypothetical protein GH714_005941 [Hevea brasiliensis]